MKTTIIYKLVLILLLAMVTSCEDYLEIDAPNHEIVSSTVFDNDETALSALKGLYNQLALVHFSGGGPSSVSVLGALSSDVLMPIYTTNLQYLEFEQHELLPNNFRNLNLWSSAYNIVYMANSILEGALSSENISENVRRRIEGEASFVRAFTYFNLVNLYGEVPLILTTDYDENSRAERKSEEQIYQQIFEDLQTAINLLDTTYSTGERTVANKYSAVALMARLQLYRENYVDAELFSSQVIDLSSTYEILQDLNSVFLANSKEAIWQLSPKGRGSILTNTQEGATFIIHPVLSFLAQFKLNPTFVEGFNSEDKRRMDWIGFHQGTNYYFSHKYKIQNSTQEVTEYSMVLRLAEQYLIRAEARAMEGNLSGAISDLDVIRQRAGLPLIADINPGIGKEALVSLILDERQKELFTEWGHRWLDLKRTGKAGEVLGGTNPLWEATDVLYPIPGAERMANPNLTQNDGY